MKLPQLTLRDLFWLVLVCALAVAWWVDRAQLIDNYQRQIKLISPALPQSSH